MSFSQENVHPPIETSGKKKPPKKTSKKKEKRKIVRKTKTKEKENVEKKIQEKIGTGFDYRIIKFQNGETIELKKRKSKLKASKKEEERKVLVSKVEKALTLRKKISKKKKKISKKKKKRVTEKKLSSVVKDVEELMKENIALLLGGYKNDIYSEEAMKDIDPEIIEEKIPFDERKKLAMMELIKYHTNFRILQDKGLISFERIKPQDIFMDEHLIKILYNLIQKNTPNGILLPLTFIDMLGYDDYKNMFKYEVEVVIMWGSYNEFKDYPSVSVEGYGRSRLELFRSFGNYQTFLHIQDLKKKIALSICIVLKSKEYNITRVKHLLKDPEIEGNIKINGMNLAIIEFLRASYPNDHIFFEYRNRDIPLAYTHNILFKYSNFGIVRKIGNTKILKRIKGPLSQILDKFLLLRTNKFPLWTTDVKVAVNETKNLEYNFSVVEPFLDEIEKRYREGLRYGNINIDRRLDDMHLTEERENRKDEILRRTSSFRDERFIKLKIKDHINIYKELTHRSNGALWFSLVDAGLVLSEPPLLSKLYALLLKNFRGISPLNFANWLKPTPSVKQISVLILYGSTKHWFKGKEKKKPGGSVIEKGTPFAFCILYWTSEYLWIFICIKDPQIESVCNIRGMQLALIREIRANVPKLPIYFSWISRVELTPDIHLFQYSGFEVLRSMADPRAGVLHDPREIKSRFPFLFEDRRNTLTRNEFQPAFVLPPNKLPIWTYEIKYKVKSWENVFPMTESMYRHFIEMEEFFLSEKEEEEAQTRMLKKEIDNWMKSEHVKENKEYGKFINSINKYQRSLYYDSEMIQKPMHKREITFGSEKLLFDSLYNDRIIRLQMTERPLKLNIDDHPSIKTFNFDSKTNIEFVLNNHDLLARLYILLYKQGTDILPYDFFELIIKHKKKKILIFTIVFAFVDIIPSVVMNTIESLFLELPGENYKRSVVPLGFCITIKHLEIFEVSIAATDLQVQEESNIHGIEFTMFRKLYSYIKKKQLEEEEDQEEEGEGEEDDKRIYYFYNYELYLDNLKRAGFIDIQDEEKQLEIVEMVVGKKEMKRRQEVFDKVLELKPFYKDNNHNIIPYISWIDEIEYRGYKFSEFDRGRLYNLRKILNTDIHNEKSSWIEYYLILMNKFSYYLDYYNEIPTVLSNNLVVLNIDHHNDIPKTYSGEYNINDADKQMYNLLARLYMIIFKHPLFFGRHYRDKLLKPKDYIYLINHFKERFSDLYRFREKWTSLTDPSNIENLIITIILDTLKEETTEKSKFGEIDIFDNKKVIPVEFCISLEYIDFIHIYSWYMDLDLIEEEGRKRSISIEIIEKLRDTYPDHPFYLYAEEKFVGYYASLGFDIFSSKTDEWMAMSRILQGGRDEKTKGMILYKLDARKSPIRIPFETKKDKMDIE